MLTVNNLALQFGKRVLFDEVNLKFTEGNCYGVIGANGAGKSTFLKILSGEQASTRGGVVLDNGKRMSVLKQNHFEYEEFDVLTTVIMGHKEMYDIMEEKNAIYMDPDATEEDGLRAADLETQYGEMGGWTAESDAAELLSNLGVTEDNHYKKVGDLTSTDKVKVLLAQALFGDPDLLLLDEPTNDLDARTIAWLSDFLADFKNTVIVVSHDRYFLDMVCTHIVDIDFSKIKMFTGNYTFWYESSQLIARQREQKNKKVEAQKKELQEFIQRFSANASKSRQATSRKKALEKLNLEDIQPSSRKYPYIAFQPEREIGNQVLNVEGLTYTATDGTVLFKDLTFTMRKGDKISVIGKNSVAITTLFEVLAGKVQADAGKIEWGQTVTYEYLPNENEEYFSGDQDISLVEWLSQFTTEEDEQFIRGFLGRMLFKGEEVYKKVSVLSGGEKVRCMLSRMMLRHPNFLLMDEPTNHLDLESVTVLNTGMKDFTGCMIFTTHDFQINNSVSNRILELHDDGGFTESMSAFEDYLAKAKEEAAMA